jgi:hypothetical protein
MRSRFALMAALAAIFAPTTSLAADPDLHLLQPLSFGAAVHSGAGTIAVDTAGSAAYTGGVEAFRQGASPSPARVSLTGDPGSALTITIAGGSTLGGWAIDQLVIAVDGSQVPVPERSADGGVPLTLSSTPGTPAEIRIGGRLTLPGGQLTHGTVSGSLLLEATYE